MSKQMMKLFTSFVTINLNLFIKAVVFIVINFLRCQRQGGTRVG